MIYKFSKNGKNIVIDSNSGAIHSVDDLVYKILDYYTPGCSKDAPWFCDLSSEYGQPTVMEAIEEIDYLIKNKQLFSPDIPYDSISIESPIKAMCLNIAHDCQLRCRYCFASHGDFGGNRCLMDEKTAKNAIDFLVLNSKNRHNLEVDFFGGEPMMNFEVIKKTVEYSKKLSKIYDKNFRFTVTTNGLGLNDEKIDYLNREMNNIVMSLDGRKEINDYMRITSSGHGSYDSIIENFKKIVKGRGSKDYYIRGTYTRKNLDFTNDVIHLYNLGFKKISLEPAVIDQDVDYAITESDLERISQEYETLANWYYSTKKVDPELIFFHFNIDFKNTTCLTKRLKGCGSGNDYIVVTPNGDIFPCHQFVGNSEFFMGNVNSHIFLEDIRKKCLLHHKECTKKCNQCWAKRWCSPCVAQKKSRPFCDFSKTRISECLSKFK